MTTKRKVKPAPKVMIENDKHLSLLMENVMADLTESVIDSLVDEGFMPLVMTDDSNISTDIKVCIQDAMRRCIRG